MGHYNIRLHLAAMGDHSRQHQIQALCSAANFFARKSERFFTGGGEYE